MKAGYSEVYLKDYVKHPYSITHIDLDITFDFATAYVVSIMELHKCENVKCDTDLVLDGENLNLKAVLYKNKNDEKFTEVPAEKFNVTQENLTIKSEILPEETNKSFYLKIIVLIYPEENTQLMGFYKSGKILCTQCEAEGFRRITYFIDRPDNMAIFKTTLRANKNIFPVLLSNGDLLQTKDCVQKLDIPTWSNINTENLHESTFLDPWLKPSYLFAIVAGNLSNISDTFDSLSKKKVELNLWCEPKHRNKLLWSLESLKKAMKWDETTFGRIFDLSTYHLVAVPQFNMGAMENKGLNIFNSSCLLVSKDSGTDSDFENCMACVAHEYFHNWTGNRITCRDWFQLVVKEGLTTYREQLFVEDNTSQATARIAVVKVIKSIQFAEDSSPLAHSIVPKSYKKIDNLYTVTVYRKGPEVIRMYSCILGKSGFRKGMDLYFERHDGQGVTFKEFHEAMQDANNVDISQFIEWFTQYGTPTVTVKEQLYGKEKKQYILIFVQERPDKQDGPPLVIPIKMGLIGKNTKNDLLQEDFVFNLVEKEAKCIINNVDEDAIPSILRGFSAPVKMIFPLMTNTDYGFLMRYDTDPVNKWESGQRLFSNIILGITKALKAKLPKLESSLENLELERDIIEALEIAVNAVEDALTSTDTKQHVDKKFLAQFITLPTEQSLMKDLKPFDPQLLCQAHLLLRKYIAKKHINRFKTIYDAMKTFLQKRDYQVIPEDVGARQLKNVVLSYISELGDKSLAMEQYKLSNNLTERFFALVILSDNIGSEQSKWVLNDYMNGLKNQDDNEMLQKWFQAQACAQNGDVLGNIQTLVNYPLFDIRNPNFVRSLLIVFARNLKQFHERSGRAYNFVAEMIIKIDTVNSQSAASLAESFLSYKDLTPELQHYMKLALEKIMSFKNLSAQTAEIVSKILA